MATTANGGLIEGVEKNGFCVFSILVSKKEAVCLDCGIVPPVFPLIENETERTVGVRLTSSLNF